MVIVVVTQGLGRDIEMQWISTFETVKGAQNYIDEYTWNEEGLRWSIAEAVEDGDFIAEDVHSVTGIE